MRNWLGLGIVALVVLLGVIVMAAPAEACPYAERAAAAKEASDGSGCWASGMFRWALMGASAWIGLFLVSYRWGLKRF
jgi:hypothetical protein